jgi:hypothetical protein
MTQSANWVNWTVVCSLADWVNGTDLCSTSHWGIGSKDCPTAYWVMRTDLDPKVKCVSGKGTIQAGTFLRNPEQEQMGRKATRQLNMMAKHKNAPAWARAKKRVVRRVGNLLNRWADLVKL